TATHKKRTGGGRGSAAGTGGGREQSGDDGDERPQYGKRSKFRTYVVTEGGETSGTQARDTDVRSEVDEAGIQHVCDYEISHRRVPTVMPHENPGFDITSKDEDGFIARYI